MALSPIRLTLSPAMVGRSLTALSTVGLGLASGLGSLPAIAQVAPQPIVPDQTLPTPSQVSVPQTNTIDISGGTQAGGNLFHSLQSFTVPDGVTASFQVPTDVQRILMQDRSSLWRSALARRSARSTLP